MTDEEYKFFIENCANKNISCHDDCPIRKKSVEACLVFVTEGIQKAYEEFCKQFNYEDD